MMEQQILTILTELNPYSDGINRETDLFKTEILDSLKLMVLINELEDAFDVVVEPEEIDAEHFSCIASIVAFLELKIA